VGAKRSINVLLVDGHRMLAEALEFVLTSQPGIASARVAETMQEAVAVASEDRPEVVLVDADLIAADEMESIEVLSEACPDSRILVLSGPDTADVVSRAMAVGARGFVLRTQSLSELLAVIKQADRGELVVPARGAGRVSVPRRKRPIDPQAGPPPRLTPREIEILRELAAGRSTSEIAEALFISPLTVRSHVKSILAKLGVRSKLEAVTVALRQGLIELSRPA
jgi:DNA-binding NarL/FixJ family response regulator